MWSLIAFLSMTVSSRASTRGQRESCQEQQITFWELEHNLNSIHDL
jgi:hypothetical protein